MPPSRAGTASGGIDQSHFVDCDMLFVSCEFADEAVTAWRVFTYSLYSAKQSVSEVSYDTFFPNSTLVVVQYLSALPVGG